MIDLEKKGEGGRVREKPVPLAEMKSLEQLEKRRRYFQSLLEYKKKRAKELSQKEKDSSSS